MGKIVFDSNLNQIEVGDEVRVSNHELVNHGKILTVGAIEPMSVGVGSIVCKNSFGDKTRFSNKSLVVIRKKGGKSIPQHCSTDETNPLKIGIFFYEMSDANNFSEGNETGDSPEFSVPVKAYSKEHCLKIFNSLDVEDKSMFDALYFDGEVYELTEGVSIVE